MQTNFKNFKSGCNWLFASLLLLTAPSSISYAAVNQSSNSLPTLEEVRAGLEETILTIDSLAVDFEITYERADDSPPGIKFSDEPSHWSWYKSGNKELIDGVTGNKTHVQIAIEDEEVTRADFNRQNPEELDHIMIMNGERRREFYQKLSPAIYLGMRLNGSENSALDLLNSSECKILGWEKILDEQCVHLDCETIDYHEGLSVHYQVWLAPERGYLPRKILSTSNIKLADGSRKKREHHQTVEKFMLVNDPILGQKRSFPEVCLSRGAGSIMTMRTTSCKINEPVSAENLTIQPQIGTEITTTMSGKSPTRVIHGGGQALSVKRQQTIDQAARNAVRNFADARPSNRTNWSNIIGWTIAFLLLGSTIVIVYLRR